MNKETEISGLLNDLKELTRQGEYNVALDMLMNYFKQNNHPQALAEAIRVSLLLKKNEQALKLFFHLYKTGQWQKYADANILLRLQLCFPHETILQNCELNPADGGKWVGSFLQENDEKLYLANLVSWNLTCGDGRSFYKFKSKCLSCDYEHIISVFMFFLIRREYLCPNCLAKQLFDYDILKSFFRKNSVCKQLDNQIDSYDEKLIQMRVTLNNDSLSANDYPLLCQYLNIDCVFILNQLIMNRLFLKQA